MAFTDAEVLEWFKLNPTASDKEIAEAAKQANIPSSQLARVTGESKENVEKRASAVGVNLTPPPKIKSPDFSNLSGLAGYDTSGLGSYTPPAKTDISPSDADVLAWFEANPNATDKEIAEAAKEANVSSDQLARVTGQTTENVDKRASAVGVDLKKDKSSKDKNDVTIGDGGQKVTLDTSKDTSGINVQQTDDATLDIPTTVTLDSGYTLTPEETTYRSGLSQDNRQVYDFLLNNKDKSNVEIGKELVNAGYSLDQVYAATGVTDPTAKAEIRTAYMTAEAELGLNPEFTTDDYNIHIGEIKNLVDSGAITEDDAYELMAKTVVDLREQGFIVSDAEIASALNEQFGTNFTAEDVAEFTKFTLENTIVPCPDGYSYDAETNSCKKVPEKCGPGRRYNFETQACENIVCPDGYKLNDAGTACERIQVNCGPGKRYDTQLQACVDISCPEGYQLNSAGNACEKIETGGTGTSGTGTSGTGTGGTGTGGTGTGPGESVIGNIVSGVPQFGEVNILDYMGLQAGEPTLPMGTKLSTQIEEITPTVGADGEMLELLPDISTADKTKLGTEDVTATATKVTSEVGGTTTVPGQVTVPTAADVTTDIVEASEFTEAGVPSQFVDPVTGELKTEENLQTMAAKKSYSKIDEEAKSFTAAKQELAEVNPLATVTGQLAILQEQFADGEVPVWASGAFRTVNALMAQRGIGGSTMAAEAITNALMQSAIPIAQQDASFYQNVTLQNLSNEQQTEMAKFNARTSAIFNDQAAVNAARSLNTQEENALTRFFAELATNVSTTNAQMSNSMEQFNATAKNQMTQFIEELGLTAETFNADQLNELSKFDAEQSNIISQFNASLQNQREQFNANNQLAIDASNVGWRRDINTANTSAENAALQFDAQNLLGIQQTSLNNIWQHYDTILNYAYQSEQNEIDRAYQLMLTTMTQEFQRSVQEDSDLMSLVGNGIKSAAIIASSPSGRDWVSDLLP